MTFGQAEATAEVSVPAVVESAHTVDDEAGLENESIQLPYGMGGVRGVLIFVIEPAVDVQVNEGDRPSARNNG